MNEQNFEKMVAEKRAAESAKLGYSPQVKAMDQWGAHEPSMAEHHATQAQEHMQSAQKSRGAAEFFAAHPEFETFIKLIRSGSIAV